MRTRLRSVSTITSRPPSNDGRRATGDLGGEITGASTSFSGEIYLLLDRVCFIISDDLIASNLFSSLDDLCYEDDEGESRIMK